jgi:DNA-directed RNA polymerase specialized sigma24 family protein
MNSEKRTDPLREAAMNYLISRDLEAFMNQSYFSMQSYVKRMLCHDPDIAGDFLLYFYEKIIPLLERYRNRQDRPFTAYLLKSIRYEFYNFKRKRNRRFISSYLVSDVGESYSTWEVDPPDPSPADGEKREWDWREALLFQLSSLPPHYRTMVKLHYGIELDRSDRKYL